MNTSIEAAEFPNSSSELFDSKALVDSSPTAYKTSSEVVTSSSRLNQAFFDSSFLDFSSE
jgi:hypothetical protein